VDASLVRKMLTLSQEVSKFLEETCKVLVDILDEFSCQDCQDWHGYVGEAVAALKAALERPIPPK
jgi:hypothetical protein